MDWIGVSAGQGQMAGSFVHSDEPSGPIKCGEFVD